jgi:hypothetical protein
MNGSNLSHATQRVCIAAALLAGCSAHQSAYPASSLIFGAKGELVGTAESGGISGNGTLCKLVP